MAMIEAVEECRSTGEMVIGGRMARIVDDKLKFKLLLDASAITEAINKVRKLKMELDRVQKQVDRTDVTEKVRWGNPDDELLPILKCVCGTPFKDWDRVIRRDVDDACPCPICGRILIWSISIIEIGGSS
jgi:hypothetical protein